MTSTHSHESDNRFIHRLIDRLSTEQEAFMKDRWVRNDKMNEPKSLPKSDTGDEKPPKRFNVRMDEGDEGFWLMVKGGTTVNITWNEIKVYRGEGSFNISYYDPHQTKLTKALMNLSNDNLAIILEGGIQLFIDDKSVEVDRMSEKFHVDVNP